MSEVTLKNGATTQETAVKAIMANLRVCADEEFIAFCELVHLCRDPSHVLFGHTGATLQARALLQGDGRPHDVVRDVVLSAVTGDDLDLAIGSPYDA